MTDDAVQDQARQAKRGRIGALIGGVVLLMGGAVVFLLVQMTQVGENGPKVGANEAEATCKGKSPGCLPEIDIVDVQGQVFTRDSMRGNVVVINFWATWCRPCLAEIPALSKFYTDNKSKGVYMLGLMTDEVELEKLEAFQKRTKMSFPTVRVDDQLLEAWEYPEALPTTFVYDRDGKLAFSKRGALRESELEREVGKLLAAEVEPAAEN
ncbi:MAG: TlpA family protein disulfide reductase [Deltaproteobacteria bacterium]|nr:TlpA family protein disulfide reductase [Deltaproteobacteria bacterium]